MKLSDFSFKYPSELIAQHPLPNRDDSRMMVLHRNEKYCEHKTVRQLPDFLQAGDLLVVNDSKVFPARLFGTTEDKHPIEILLTHKRETITHKRAPQGSEWVCLAKPMKRLCTGSMIYFSERLQGRVENVENGFGTISFQNKDAEKEIFRCGVPPLPPYIRRKSREDYAQEDWERYQTVYAKTVGSSAAPTAGLHLTEDLLANVKKKNVSIVPITLHVSSDTFLPVRAERIEDHVMHGETLLISEVHAEQINTAKREGRRIVAVGTTTVRALESSWEEGLLGHGKRKTCLFIHPGYNFRVVDAMLTNFHQPESTLLMMVSAFAGRELILESYEEALREKYRLFSYGDCMLIA